LVKNSRLAMPSHLSSLSPGFYLLSVRSVPSLVLDPFLLFVVLLTDDPPGAGMERGIRGDEFWLGGELKWRNEAENVALF
jgi:hypothetical protein